LNLFLNHATYSLGVTGLHTTALMKSFRPTCIQIRNKNYTNETLNTTPTNNEQCPWSPFEALKHQLKNNLLVQNTWQATKYITPSSPFLYLGVTLTMNLIWKHQHRHMDENLKQKLDALEGSYVSPPRQTLNIIRTAIIPSLAYALNFAVTPCSYPNLDKWDAMIGRVIKSIHNFLWRSTLTAMIREDVLSFGLGAPSIYARGIPQALSSSTRNKHRRPF